MPRLKLKQASAVLQIEPKKLQNLVQFGVLKPKRFEGTYFFDTNTLMVAKVAFCLKESLGTRTSVLSKLMDVFLASEKEFKSDSRRRARSQEPTGDQDLAVREPYGCMAFTANTHFRRIRK
jgi:hypothetical protein